VPQRPEEPNDPIDGRLVEPRPRDILRRRGLPQRPRGHGHAGSVVQVLIVVALGAANGQPAAAGGAEAKLADMSGAEAVSAATGFVQSCAASFWTQDSGTFWNFSATSAGQCTAAATSPFSDLPDGSIVEKGAAAEVLRRGNDPAAATPTNAVNRTVLTCAGTGSCPSLVAFNTTNVSQAAVGAADAAEHQKIIDFALGKDVNDENANADLT